MPSGSRPRGDAHCSLDVAHTSRIVRSTELGLLTDDDLQQLVVLVRALPRQGDVQRQLEATKLAEPRVHPLLVDVPVGPRPVRRGETGARGEDAAMPKTEPNGGCA